MAERETLPSWTQPAHHGAAGSGVVLAGATIAAAWSVQGDPGRASFRDEVKRLFGVALPLAPNTMARSDTLSALWLGPRAWLLAAGGASPLADFEAKRAAMNGARGGLFDLGASRIAWKISGPQAATVLAKGCPLDFHPRAFPPGTCAQSLLGHINALVVRNADDSFTLMVARSYARDAWHALIDSAAQYGCEVRAPEPFR